MDVLRSLSLFILLDMKATSREIIAEYVCCVVVCLIACNKTSVFTVMLESYVRWICTELLETSIWMVLLDWDVPGNLELDLLWAILLWGVLPLVVASLQRGYVMNYSKHEVLGKLSPRINKANRFVYWICYSFFLVSYYFNLVLRNWVVFFRSW